MPHQLVTALLIGVDPVLLLEGSQAALEGDQDGVVLMQSSEAIGQTLTETEDPIQPRQPSVSGDPHPSAAFGRLACGTGWRCSLWTVPLRRAAESVATIPVHLCSG